MTIGIDILTGEKINFSHDRHYKGKSIVSFPDDYCKSIKDGKSSKQKKAEKLKLDGYDIEIIPENVFYDIISEN